MAESMPPLNLPYTQRRFIGALTESRKKEASLPSWEEFESIYGAELCRRQIQHWCQTPVDYEMILPMARDYVVDLIHFVCHNTNTFVAEHIALEYRQEEFYIGLRRLAMFERLYVCGPMIANDFVYNRAIKMAREKKTTAAMDHDDMTTIDWTAEIDVTVPRDVNQCTLFTTMEHPTLGATIHEALGQGQFSIQTVETLFCNHTQHIIRFVVDSRSRKASAPQWTITVHLRPYNSVAAFTSQLRYNADGILLDLHQNAWVYTRFAQSYIDTYTLVAIYPENTPNESVINREVKRYHNIMVVRVPLRITPIAPIA